LKTFHPLIPGGTIPQDWYNGKLPQSIQVGIGCLINTSHCFKNYFSTRNPGIIIGNQCVFYDTSLAVEQNGQLIIGDRCFLASAAIVVAKEIRIGNDVYVSGGVTIVDSNFHPLEPELRKKDILALLPSGDKMKRPPIQSKVVRIDNGVWIGINATIMSGVHIGENAIIEPGSVVISDVPANARVMGNPASIIN